jgi:protocatechuate 3,4-dioxygenase beta subunit
MNKETFEIICHPVRTARIQFWVCPKCDIPYAPVDWPTDSHLRAWHLHLKVCPKEMMDNYATGDI